MLVDSLVRQNADTRPVRTLYLEYVFSNKPHQKSTPLGGAAGQI